ncbi:MAG: hypothetical protein AVDCRST_MAG15-1268 [uncultured Rubellimicrobium sp.]|uniref:Uncharacterized protein n=1 Tax=uncultured Rubellimicrobium sp. TaxID=543078 RepID=A0A6J4P429_9RHOB|nr:MAG: hypothetical protein AVDCRST_MAG15-1268 [uncultured Rubellimicrobium sp.]
MSPVSVSLLRRGDPSERRAERPAQRRLRRSRRARGCVMGRDLSGIRSGGEGGFAGFGRWRLSGVRGGSSGLSMARSPGDGQVVGGWMEAVGPLRSAA